MPTSQTISVIIPAFNEEQNISVIVKHLQEVLTGYNHEILFVDDGSTDNTLNVLKALRSQDSRIRYLSFSRNFGHQNALKAGIDHATGDCIISIDADMQHPPSLISDMIHRWDEGYDVVYTQRMDLNKGPYFKRKTSAVFYKIINILSDIRIEPGTADYRLINRHVAEVVKQSGESNLFIRGYIPWMGFRQFKIQYEPNQRHSGQTKYTFRKMVRLAINGLTSFSIRPLRLSIVLGSLISGGAFLYALYAVYIYLFTNQAISGWASILGSVLFIGGLQLLILGIIGEYIGKIFIQTKNRPSYIVRERS